MADVFERGGLIVEVSLCSVQAFFVVREVLCMLLVKRLLLQGSFFVSQVVVGEEQCVKGDLGKGQVSHRVGPLEFRTLPDNLVEHCKRSIVLVQQHGLGQHRNLRVRVEKCELIGREGLLMQRIIDFVIGGNGA